MSAIVDGLEESLSDIVPMKCSEEIYDMIESGYRLDCAIWEIDAERIWIQIKRH